MSGKRRIQRSPKDCLRGAAFLPLRLPERQAHRHPAIALAPASSEESQDETLRNGWALALSSGTGALAPAESAPAVATNQPSTATPALHRGIQLKFLASGGPVLGRGQPLLFDALWLRPSDGKYFEAPYFAAPGGQISGPCG